MNGLLTEEKYIRPLVKVAEMQSELEAAGSVHGSLAAGALSTTYTSSQGFAYDPEHV